MTALAILGLLAGLAVLTLLVLSYGLGGIWHSAALLGLDGFAVIVATHLALIAAMGTAWWLLGRTQPGATLPRFMWARLIRDSASEALPLSQVGGFVFGARALALTGIAGSFAAASTVVDVSVELVAQLAYTMLGLLLLEQLRPDNPFAGPVLAGVAAMTLAVAVFVAVQARSAGFIERIGVRLARQFLGPASGGRNTAGQGAIQRGISDLHRRPATLGLAATIHLGEWILNGLETWVTLRLMGIPITPTAAVTIDSLLYGLRSAAFMVPNAIGVQEEALVVLGGLFGIGPDAALALSLVKRARDLAIGIPALLAWQAMEGRRAWLRGF